MYVAALVYWPMYWLILVCVFACWYVPLLLLIVVCVPLGVVGANDDFSMVVAHVECGGGASMVVSDIY